MTIDASAIDHEIEEQRDLIGRMLHARSPDELADLGGRLHDLLLRRQALIAHELSSAGDPVNDAWSRRPPRPLSLSDERGRFLKAAAMQQIRSPDAAADAYRALVRLRNANNWWRERNMLLLLENLADRNRPTDVRGDDDEETAARRAAVRLLIEDMAGHAGHDVTRDPAVEADAEKHEWPEVRLNEDRERRLVDAMMPRASAIGSETAGGPRREWDDDDDGRWDDDDDRRRSSPDFDVIDSPSGRSPEFDGEPEPQPSSSTWQRTPHMDVAPAGRLAPEAEFEIDIYADIEAARPGESVGAVRISSEVPRAELDVLLTHSDHFEIVEQSYERLVLERTKPSSNRLTYRLRVKAEAMLDALSERLPSRHRGSVTAVFSYNGRPAGQVRRVIELSLADTARDAAAEGQRNVEGARNREHVAPPGDAIAFRVDDAKTADMIVRIMESDDSDGTDFVCQVTTGYETTTQPWKTIARTGDLVGNYMSGLTEKGLGESQILARLHAAGTNMFKASPKNFQKAYWRLVDLGEPPETIQIVTAEPHFLWELMIPERPGDDERDSLGVSASIGRWLSGDSTAPPQKIEVNDAYVFAPDYERGPLPHAKTEAEIVCRLFDGQRIDPATYERLIDAVKERGVTLLHFACHGISGKDGIKQTIKLAGGKSFAPEDLEGNREFRRFMRATRPVVFLNACQLGRTQLALAGGGGFPAVFMKLGASAVIAAAWSVKDKLAHQIALKFYDRLKEKPDAPLADVFKEIRKSAYDDKEDTYAAYSFYGDPLAQRNA